MNTPRNHPCHCGSGKKYKKCCFNEDMKKSDPDFLMSHASEYPVVGCLIQEDWEENGLASILIIRKNLETKRFLFAMFLIDTYCLGIKDAWAQGNVNEGTIDDLMDMHPCKMVDSDYEYCRGLILGARDYAKGLGFEPHEDWGKNKEFVEGDKPYKTSHVFGKEGEPFYIEGPDDDVEKIIQQLKKHHRSDQEHSAKKFLHRLRGIFSKKTATHSNVHHPR